MPGLKHIIQQHPLAIGITTAIISVVALGSVWFFVAQNKQEDVTNAAASERYAVQSVDLPVKSLSPSELSSVQSLSINGQLNVNNSLILSPSSRPSSPVKGQLYYDGTSNTIAYYDGTVFTSVADSVGQSVQDTRINQVEQEIVTLRNTAPAIPADIALLGSNNTFSGTNLFDGSITANGLYVNAAAQVAQNLLVGGSTTVSQSLTVNGAATLGATSISSLVLSTTLPVTSGGTGVGSFSANGVVIGNGTNPLGSVSAGAADLCFMSTSGAPEFKPCPGGVGSGVNSLNGLYGSLSIANATAAGSTITINNASTSAKGLAQFNATNFTVTGGVVNTAQNIATTATPTFSALQVTNNATIGGALTIGIACTPGQILTTNGSGTVVCVTDDTGTDTNTTYAAGSGITITGAANTISVNPQTGGGLSFTGGQLGLIGCSAGQILKYTGTTWGCAADADTISPGDGVGVTAVGTLNSQTKNSNGATIYNNGGTLTVALQSADATNPGLITTGAQTFSGAKVFSDDISLQGSIGQSGTGTFTTGTGAVALNGDVTIASGKSLTLGVSCAANQVLTTNSSGVITCAADNTGTDTNTTYTAGDGISISGASNTIAVSPQAGGGLSFSSGQLGLIACTAGQILKYTGTAWGCATDSDTVSPGDGIGVTAVGTLDGQTKNSNGAAIYNNGGTLTIALQTADTSVAGLVSTGLQTFSGAKTFTSPLTVQNNFVQSGAATFTTGTGAVALNGDVTIASGKGLTLGASCSSGQVLTTNGSGVVTCVTDNMGTDTNTTYAAGDGIAITGASNTISVNPQTGGGLEFAGGQLGLLACTTGQILKYDGADWVCATDSDTISSGDGIGVTAVGALDSQTKNSNGATIYNNGGTLTIALQSADGVNAGVVTVGSQTFGGAKTFSDTVAVQGAFTQTGTGTFSTGTGAVALNGNVTIASGSTLTIGTACTAGQVLTTDTNGVITCATDDTGTDTNTTYTAGDGITITGGANTISVQLQTGGGLGFVSGQLGLLNSCTDGQVLKANSGTWTCADDLDTNTGAPIASGSGTSGTVVKFNASGELADSGLAEVGTTATYSGNFIINGQTGFTGNLLDVQLNGASRLSVTESGSTTISGGLAVAGASGVTVGVAGSVQGSLKLATTDAGTLTIQSQPQAGNVTLSIPAITGNDTICLQTLANCGGEAGGVTTIGALDSQTRDANGATIVGTTLYLQTADTTSAGIISTGTQTIAGDKTFKSVANSQTAFRIQNATNDSIFVANTSANVITAGQANTAVDSFTKLADPSTLPPNSAQAVSYSNNGRYLVVAHQSSPYVTAYVRSGNSLTALSSSAFDILPSGTVYSIAFTQDDQYLALGAFSATSGINNLYVYKVQGDTFTKIADPSSLPAGNNVQGLSWSPDGTYLAVGTNSSDFLVVYKRSGDTLSALTLASLPSTPVRSIKFSPDGAYLAVGHNTNPYVTMYKRSGDTFTPLANPFSTSATGQVWGVDFSRDGTYFAAAHATFPYLSIYKRSGDTFTKLSNPATLPSSQGNAVHFSANGNYLAVAHNNSPYLSIYKRSGDTFTKLSNPATLPAGNGSGAAFSPDGRYLSVASASSPYITTYDLTNGKNVDVKVNGSVIADRTSTTSLYVGNDTNLQGKITVGGGAQFNGTATFSNATTVAADFSIQNSAASTNILYANSSANTITIGQGYTDTLSFVSGVTALSGGSGTDTAFSRTGNYLAAINTSSPYIHTYKYNANGTFTKLANPDTLPGVSTGVALSSDATYMVVTQTAATRFAVYKRSGDTFAKLTNPTQPSGNAYAAAFSKDDAYLAIAHASSPYLSIYKRSGDTFTKLSDPASLPAGQGNSVAFSDNGDYLVVGHNSAPYITIYKRSGDTFTKLADPSTLPTSSVNGVAFSPDNGYMAVAYNSSPYVLIYKRSGDTFTKLADPSTLPASNANGVAFSADGTFLTVAHDSTPYITTYKRSSDTFTKLANPGTLPAGSANGVAYSGDGRYMSVSHGSGSLLTVYSLGKIDVATNIYGSLGVAGNASFTGLTVSGTTTFQDTISGTDAAFGAGVAIGTVGQSAGELTIASSGTGSVALTTATQTDDYAITIPTLAGDDIVCLQNLGNCAGGSGGVNTSGTVTAGALTKFDGSGGITSSGLTESGTSLNYGGNVVANVDSGFSGHILDLQKAGSSVFKVGSSGLVTTAGGISGVAATGTNATGGNLTIQAGSGTGSAGSGVISFSTASQAQDPFVKDLTPAGQFYQSSSAAVSASFSQTVTSGSNQVLLVTMATGHGGVSATSVTYGGVALTKLAGVRQTFDASYTEMWYLVNPNVGSATVSITLNTSATLYARAMVLTGVNQTTPFNTACTATASTTSITCSADTSGAGVVVSLLRASATYSSMGSGQVSVYGNETPPAYTSVSVKPTTTSSTSMSYTLSSGTYWGFVAVGVRLADTGVNPMGLTLVDTGVLEGGPLTERMRIASDGKVGIGTFNPQYQLDVAGDINTSTGFRVGGTAGVSLSCSGATQTLGNVTVTGGIITAASCATNSSDLAENYASTDNLAAGEIVMTSGVATSVNRATSAHRGDVIGVVSTAPGILIGTEQVPDGYPIALSGRVPVKVTNENGPIAVGDKITISSVAGVGMKATTSGMIVGTALEAFNGEEGTVEVFVNASYWAPSASETLQGATAEFTSLNVSGEATIATLSVGTVAVTGDITVHGLLTVANIVVNGHVITASGKPTVEAQTALNGGNVTVEGTDTVGTITITTGSTPTAGELAKIIFSQTYTKAPRVIVSPSNEAAADFAYYKGAVSLDDFMLNAKFTPAANTTYVFDYFIAE